MYLVLTKAMMKVCFLCEKSKVFDRDQLHEGIIFQLRQNGISDQIRKIELYQREEVLLEVKVTGKNYAMNWVWKHYQKKVHKSIYSPRKGTQRIFYARVYAI